MVEDPNESRPVLLNSIDEEVNPVANETLPVPPVVVDVPLLCGYGAELVILPRYEPLLSAVIDEGSWPTLGAGLVTVPVGHNVVVSFDRG